VREREREREERPHVWALYDALIAGGTTRANCTIAVSQRCTTTGQHGDNRMCESYNNRSHRVRTVGLTQETVQGDVNHTTVTSARVSDKFVSWKIFPEIF
jgi:hypothetical protein